MNRGGYPIICEMAEMHDVICSDTVTMEQLESVAKRLFAISGNIQGKEIEQEVWHLTCTELQQRIRTVESGINILQTNWRYISSNKMYETECGICNEFHRYFQTVVTDCGHVFCEPCFFSENEKSLCSVCGNTVRSVTSYDKHLPIYNRNGRCVRAPQGAKQKVKRV